MCSLIGLLLLSACSDSTGGQSSINSVQSGDQSESVGNSKGPACTISPDLALECSASFSQEKIVESKEYFHLNVTIKNESGRNLVYRPLPGFATLILASDMEGFSTPRLLSETHDFIPTGEVESEALATDAEVSFPFLSENAEPLAENKFAKLLLVMYIEGVYTILSSDLIEIR